MLDNLIAVGDFFGTKEKKWNMSITYTGVRFFYQDGKYWKKIFTLTFKQQEHVPFHLLRAYHLQLRLALRS